MTKHLYVLAVSAIVAIVLGVWLVQKDAIEVSQDNWLFEGLKTVANEVQSVEIENSQGLIFAAQKTEEIWLSQFNSNLPLYPLEQRELAELVNVLMQTKLVEAKTSKVENYPLLGLQDIDATDSLANLVTIKTANKSWQVLVGNQVSLGEGSYVRLPKKSQSWQTDKTISLPLDEYDWLKQPILPFEEQEMSTIARIDGDKWQMQKASHGDFELLNMPTGKVLEYDSVLNSVAANLASLRFEQLKGFSDDFSDVLQVLTRLNVITTSNHRFQVVVSRHDENYFVHFDVNDPIEYWHQWLYQISEFSAQQLIKQVDDFLKDESGKETSNQNATKNIDEGESPN